MRLQERVLWAAGIFFADMLVLFIPVAALFLGYILISRPEWFRIWLNRVYE